MVAVQARRENLDFVQSAKPLCDGIALLKAGRRTPPQFFVEQSALLIQCPDRCVRSHSELMFLDQALSEEDPDDDGCGPYESRHDRLTHPPNRSVSE